MFHIFPSEIILKLFSFSVDPVEDVISVINSAVFFYLKISQPVKGNKKLFSVAPKLPTILKFCKFSSR